MGTQMSSARRGIPTEEMLQVAKDEDIDINFIIKDLSVQIERICTDKISKKFRS